MMKILPNSMERSPKTTCRHAFTLIEIVIATGLLAILLGGVFCSLRLTSAAQRRSMRRRKALHVIDNTVERLAAERRFEDQAVRAALHDEFARSDLANAADLQPECMPSDAGWRLVVRRRGGRKIASVEVSRP
ncbi:MAG: type II secretion system protein [Lentisphaeria bacterium]|nr:type II secretion system protein [Lentisphaeria bacterium]